MVSDAVAISGIITVGGIVTIVVRSWMNRIDKRSAARDEKMDKKVTLMAEKQEEVHKQIDGKMEQLLEATGAKERAEGINEGIAQKQIEVDQLNKDSTPKKE